MIWVISESLEFIPESISKIQSAPNLFKDFSHFIQFSPAYRVHLRSESYNAQSAFFKSSCEALDFIFNKTIFQAGTNSICSRRVCMICSYVLERQAAASSEHR